MTTRLVCLPAIVLALSLASPVLADSASHGMAQDEDAHQPAGIVVESVGKGSAVEKAGLRPGDVLYRWERLPNPPANPDPASGVFDSPFDWWEVEIEQAPRGTVRLEGDRDTRRQRWTAPPGDFAAAVLPHKQAIGPPNSNATACKGGAPKPLDIEQLSITWLSIIATRDSAATISETTNPVPPLIQDLSCLRPLHRSYATMELANSARRQGRLSSARALSEHMTSNFPGEHLDTLTEAAVLNSAGAIAIAVGDLEQGHTYLQRALLLREVLAPGSLAEAATIANLGIHAFLGGEYSLAEKRFRKSLRRYEALASDTDHPLSIESNLANMMIYTGRIQQAEILLRNVIAKREANGTDPLDIARASNSLSIILWQRGKLEESASLLRHSLLVTGERDTHNSAYGRTLANLGSLELQRANLSLARVYFERALQIERANGVENPATLNSLGIVHQEEGDLQAAVALFSEALAKQQSLAPKSSFSAIFANNIGYALSLLGHLDKASARYAEALSLLEELSPGSLETAHVLSNVGKLAGTQGEWELATSYLERSITIRERLAPGCSPAELLERGRIARLRGDAHSALSFFERSLLSTQRCIKGHDSSLENEVFFRDANQRPAFQEAINLYEETGSPRRAFHTLERSRAHSFLTMTTERDLVYVDLPTDLETKRRSTRVLYNRTLQQMQGLSPDRSPDLEKIKAIRGEQVFLRESQQRIETELRKRFPDYAAIQYPQPLTSEAARKALDPGTALLAYSVGESECHVFIIRHGHNLEVHTLQIEEDTLSGNVRDLRNAIEDGRFAGELGENRRSHLRTLSRDLYDSLLAPAEPAIAESKRVLVLPDGPLHFLPFGALLRPNGEYVAEWKPIHVAQSATTWALLKAKRPGASTTAPPLPAAFSPTSAPVQSCSLRTPPDSSFLGFGDPHYPQRLREEAVKTATATPETRVTAMFDRGGLVDEEISDIRVRSALERGLFDWSDLPATGTEVAAIRPLMDDGSARVFVGADATEEAFKTWAGGARILHVAAHAHIDDRFPWNSALVLSIPESFEDGRDNGLLQVWEIMESVRLPNADLVVLSACSTAVGDEQGGEGIVGLTRAFQFAGARTVAASLWNVADDTTAALMERFYQHLAAGKPKDEALQAAQIEFIRGPVTVTTADGRQAERDASAPYYWAAFQLYGDWQ